jgi:drug/metabolite transporter (DMT)-like permease
MSFLINGLITLSLWSSAFVGVRYVMTDYDPFEFAFLRLCFATMTLGVIVKCTGNSFLSFRESLPFSLTGFLGACLYFSFINLGQVTLGATEACVLINTIPLFTALLSWVFLKEHLKLHVWMGFFISLLGVSFIATANQSGSFKLNIGALWIVAAAICTASCTLIQKKLLNKYSPAVAVFYTTLYGTAFCIPFGWKGLLHFSQNELAINAAIIYLGVFPAGIACYFWLKILQQTTAAKAVTLLYLTPVMTSIFSYFMLGERLGFSALTGAALTMLGVILSQSQQPLSLSRFLKARFITLVSR